MGMPPPVPPTPNWGDIDRWIATRHEPAEEGPAATHSQADLDTLVADLQRDAKRLTTNSAREHIPDALIVLLVAAFVILAIRQQFVYSAVDQVTIQAPEGLAAFHVITDADLTTRRLTPQTGSIRSVELARGRYLLQYVPKGSALRQSQLSRTRGWAARLKGLSVVDLPVRLGPSLPAVETNVTVIASRHGSESPGSLVLNDVPLLALRRMGSVSWATVGLSQDQMLSISPYLGKSDIFIARIVH